MYSVLLSLMQPRNLSVGISHGHEVFVDRFINDDAGFTISTADSYLLVFISLWNAQKILIKKGSSKTLF